MTTNSIKWIINMRMKPCFSSKRRGIDNTNCIFNISNINFSFFCMNSSNESYSSLTCSGWIKSNTCSHREDIPTEGRRRLSSRYSMNHGAAAVVVSVLKRATPFDFFSWTKNGVRSSRFVSYLVLLIWKRFHEFRL